MVSLLLNHFLVELNEMGASMNDRSTMGIFYLTVAKMSRCNRRNALPFSGASKETINCNIISKYTWLSIRQKHQLRGSSMKLVTESSWRKDRCKLRFTFNEARLWLGEAEGGSPFMLHSAELIGPVLKGLQKAFTNIQVKWLHPLIQENKQNINQSVKVYNDTLDKLSLMNWSRMHNLFCPQIFTSFLLLLSEIYRKA